MVRGWWKDTGKTEDILDANRLILDTIVEKNLGTIESGTIRGRVNIGKNTVIRGNTIIEGPAIIGEDCTISTSHIGPYTSIGNGSTLLSADIENSIVLDGATLDNVDRISESLIGKNVTIRRNDTLNGGKKFVLGDSSQVML